MTDTDRTLIRIRTLCDEIATLMREVNAGTVSIDTIDPAETEVRLYLRKPADLYDLGCEIHRSSPTESTYGTQAVVKGTVYGMECWAIHHKVGGVW